MKIRILNWYTKYDIRAFINSSGVYENRGQPVLKTLHRKKIQQ